MDIIAARNPLINCDFKAVSTTKKAPVPALVPLGIGKVMTMHVNALPSGTARAKRFKPDAPPNQLSESRMIRPCHHIRGELGAGLQAETGDRDRGGMCAAYQR